MISTPAAAHPTGSDDGILIECMHGGGMQHKSNADSIYQNSVAGVQAAEEIDSPAEY